MSAGKLEEALKMPCAMVEGEGEAIFANGASRRRRLDIRYGWWEVRFRMMC